MPVGHSLMRLVITEQKVARMENLHLPNLRDLLLHCNEIVRIEGLDHCPKLQRLWLFSNRIAKIENLEGVPDLRELWLQVRDHLRRAWPPSTFPPPSPPLCQDNRLTRISGVEHLVNLQVVAFGNNRIAEFKDIQVRGVAVLSRHQVSIFLTVMSCRNLRTCLFSDPYLSMT
jgi:Leucine-rich repeat (LRR) protein